MSSGSRPHSHRFLAADAQIRRNSLTSSPSRESGSGAASGSAAAGPARECECECERGDECARCPAGSARPAVARCVSCVCGVARACL